jgi:hypothetical protein
MIMRRNLIAAISFLFLQAYIPVSPAAAQSMYGLNFLGEHRFRGSARDRALAYSTFAVPDSNNAITANPASMGDLTRVTFSVFEVLDMSRSRVSGEVVDQNRFLLPAVMIAVPVRQGLVLGTGYRTRFEGRGDCSFPGTLPGAPVPYEIYKRRSSLFMVPFTLALRVNKFVSIGGELQLEGGSIRDEQTVDFEKSGYEAAVFERKRVFSGTSWAASFLARPHRRFHIGAYLDNEINYNVEEEFSFSRKDLDSSAVWDFELPPAYGLGIAVEFYDRWWLTSGFWKRDAPDPVGFPQFKYSLEDERLISVGLERRGGVEGGFWSRMPIRLGYYDNRWHLQFPAGEPVNARFMTFGTGFPMPGGPGTIEFSLEFGYIGSGDDNAPEERLVRAGLSLNVSESWSRRKEDRH